MTYLKMFHFQYINLVKGRNEIRKSRETFQEIMFSSRNSANIWYLIKRFFFFSADILLIFWRFYQDSN